MDSPPEPRMRILRGWLVDVGVPGAGLYERADWMRSRTDILKDWRKMTSLV